MGHNPLPPKREPTALARVREAYALGEIPLETLEERVEYLLRHGRADHRARAPWEVPPKRDDAARSAIPPRRRSLSMSEARRLRDEGILPAELEYLAEPTFVER